MKDIGVDTGGSFTRIWDGEQKILKMKTPRSYTEYLQLLASHLSSYLPIRNLSIALPAVIEKQQILTAPNLGESWDRQTVAVDMRKRLSVAGEIFIMQDTEAAGYTVQKEELNGLEPTMLIALSTGVGGAFITSQYVLPLEVGHMILNLSGRNAKCPCGQYGCVETDLSGTSLSSRFGIQAEYLDNADVWSEYGTELGQFFVVLSALFKLKQILLIGGVSQRYSSFIKETELVLKEKLKRVPCPTVRVSGIGDSAGVRGAYWFASARRT